MTSPKSRPTPRTTSIIWLAAAIAWSGALTSACADTEDRFLPPSRGPDTSNSDDSEDPPSGDSASSPSDDLQDQPGSAAGSGTNGGSGQNKGAEPAAPVTKAGSAPKATTPVATASAGAGASNAIDLDAGMPDVDVGKTLDCSAELAICLEQNKAMVDPCLTSFSTCGDVLETASDAKDATCALQLTGCLLSAADVNECAADYASCLR
jgi:hypothetical protein